MSGALVMVGAVLAMTGAALARDPGGDQPPGYGEIPTTAAIPTPREPAQRAQPKPRTPSPRVTAQPDRLPLRLRVPSVSAEAAVVAVGVRSDRSLVLPPPNQVGWWIGGARPGDATGTAVLAGHVDAEDGSHGALYGLTSVRQGDTVQVDTAAGRITYRVVAMRSFPKQHLPAAVFAQGGPHRLVLITCGGTFVPGRGYARNVVAYAEVVKP